MIIESSVYKIRVILTGIYNLAIAEFAIMEISLDIWDSVLIMT